MSFSTPHAGLLLLLTGVALLLFACALVLQQPARFIPVPAATMQQFRPEVTPFYDNLLDDEWAIASRPTELTDKALDLWKREPFSRPDCHEIAKKHWICTGFARNPHDFTLDHPAVTLNLFEKGQFISEKQAFLATHQLLPGAAVPYHIYVDGDAISAEITPEIQYVSAVSQHITHWLYVSDVQLTHQQAAAGYDTYTIEARLHNPHAQALKSIRVIVTLLDERGRIAAYRRYEIATLQANQTQKTQFTLISWWNHARLRPHIIAEGQLSNQAP